MTAQVSSPTISSSLSTAPGPARELTRGCVLSRLQLNPPDQLVRAETADACAMHARVCSAVDGLPAPDGGRVLWSHPRPDVLLIQTGAPVSPSAFPAGYRAGPVGVVDVVDRLAGLAAGDRVEFGLIANPTRATAKITHPDGSRRSRGTRRPLRDQAERDAWLRRRLDGVLADVELTSHPVGNSGGRQRSTGRLILHVRHAWFGAGAVADVERLRDLVLAGVGSAKGYGCGLLVIR